MIVGGPSPISQPIGQQFVQRTDQAFDSDRARQVAAQEQAVEQSPAPAGVNAELWSVLTQQEKAFFVQQRDLGSLTYSPTRSSPQAMDAPRGQRIDVTV